MYLVQHAEELKGHLDAGDGGTPGLSGGLGGKNTRQGVHEETVEEWQTTPAVSWGDPDLHA